MNKKKDDRMKKKQYPLYLTKDQKKALDNIYQVMLDDFGGDLTYQQFLRLIVAKGAKYFKVKYKIEDNNSSLRIIEIKSQGAPLPKDAENSTYSTYTDNFDIDEITGGRI